MVRTLSVCCLVFVMMGTVSAAQRGAATGPAEDASNRSTYVRRMMSLDRNADGRLSQQELPGNLAAQLAPHDADGDGYLSPTELAAMEDQAMASRQSQQDGTPPRATGRQGAGRRGRRLSDTSGDGSPLDPQQILRFALTFDKDKDGGLNAAELQQYATALARRRAAGRRQESGDTEPDRPAKPAATPQGLNADGVGDGGFGDSPQPRPR